MAPVKFDDIPKVANELLNDDFQVNGHVLKTKQKTTWGGAVLSSQVDLYGHGSTATPAKLTWKIPSPFGVSAVSVDKLEMDKSGKFKLEMSGGCPVMPGCKFDCKSDLVDVNNASVGITYTGVRNAQVKFETKLAKPQEFAGEVTYSCPVAITGVKYSIAMLAQGALPDFGVRVKRGPYFGALLAKESLGTFTASCCYTATKEVKCGATYTHGGKANGSYAIGVSCKGLYKIKATSDQSVLCSAKVDVAKGFSTLLGFKYNAKKGDWSYGAQLTVE